jgi:hypothetical protein
MIQEIVQKSVSHFKIGKSQPIPVDMGNSGWFDTPNGQVPGLEHQRLNGDIAHIKGGVIPFSGTM